MYVCVYSKGARFKTHRYMNVYIVGEPNLKHTDI